MIDQKGKGCIEGVRQFGPIRVGRNVGLWGVYYGYRIIDWTEKKESPIGLLESLYLFPAVVGGLLEVAGGIIGFINLATKNELNAAGNGWTPREIIKDAWMHD